MHEGDLWPALRENWHVVALSDDVGEKPVSVRLLDERVVLCRLGGRVRAFQDLCVHRGTPLSLGWVDGEELVCAYHGWSYASDGKCTRIPSVPPGHPIPKRACLTRYLAEERHGLIWVCLSESPRAPIPDAPELGEPGYHVFFKQKHYWKCTAARAIENFVDLGHFPWVHEGILGERDRPLTPDMKVERDGESLRFGYQNISDGLHGAAHKRMYRLTRPFTIYQWKVEGEGRAEVYLFSVTPHSARDCTRFLIIARNYDLDAPEIVQGPVRAENGEYWLGDGSSAKSVRAGNGLPEYANALDTIAIQDQPIVENQRPEELPLDLAEELHLKGPDVVAIAYRRFMAELGVDIDARGPERVG